MPGFERRLPDVVVRVYEAGGDDFGLAVDYFGSGWWGDVSSDLCDLAAGEEDADVPLHRDVVVVIVHEKRSTSENNWVWCSHCGSGKVEMV